MKTSKQIIFCLGIKMLLFFFFGKNASAQMATEHPKSFQLDDTHYEFPYVIPSEESIKENMERLFNYFYLSTPCRIINEKTGEVITDFKTVDPDAVIDKGIASFNLWDYTLGVAYTAMFVVGRQLNDQRFLDYPIKNFDFIFEHLPYFREKAQKYGVKRDGFHPIINMHALDDCGSIGAALIQAYKIKQAPEYRAMIDTIANFITNKQFRLSDGTLGRQRPQEVSLWSDDFYMCIPFLARMGQLTDDNKYYEDAVRQVIQLSDRLFVWEKKLYDHGWNQCAGEYDPHFYWSRANGWAMMAIVTLLDALPDKYPGRNEVLKIYRTHVQGIAEMQGGNGLWYNLLDRFDTYPETSGTAMFVYSIAKGVNEGWIDHTYASVAQAGWNGLTMYINRDGKIENMCRSTKFSGDICYYYHRPASFEHTHGHGAALLAGSEMIRLLKNPELEVKKQARSYHYRIKDEE